jgi:hypothetical protein
MKNTNTATGTGNSAVQYHAITKGETTVRIQAQFWDDKTEFVIPAGTLVKLDLCAVDVSQGRIQSRYCYKGRCVPVRVMGHSAPFGEFHHGAHGSFIVADLELV